MNDTGRIGLVDDNPSNLTAMRRVLELAGYEVLTGLNGTQALELIRAHRPDLVLVDVNLPDISGIEVCQQIKQDVELVGTYIVLFSAATTSTENQAVGLEAGADGYVALPISNRELVARVKAMFRLRSTELALQHAERETRQLLEESEASRRALLSILEDQKRAEEALRESEERYRTLVEGQGEGIAITDTEEHFVFANPAAENIFGVPPGELLGRSLEEFTTPQQFAAIRRQTVRRQSTGKEAYEMELIRPDSERRNILVTATPRCDNAGRYIGAFGIFRDITERKRADEALRLQSEIATNLSEGISLVRVADNVIVYANSKFEQMFGYDAGELIGKPVSVLNAPDLSNPAVTAEAIGEKTHAAYRWTGEIHNIRKDGTRFWSYASISQFDHTEHGAVQVTVQQDITDRKRVEEEIKRQLSRLNSLRQIDMTIGASFDLNLTLDMISKQVVSQLGVDASAILLFNRYFKILEYATSHGFHSNALRYTRLKPGEGYAGRVALERKMLHVPGLMETQGKLAAALNQANEAFADYYGVPLIVKGELKGVLEIYHRSPLQAEPSWLEFLEILAGQTAIAIDNAQLFGDLQRSSDDLVTAYDTTIEGWSRALDLRDKETEGHTQRVTKITLYLARQMDIAESELVHIRRGALLHDIGKIGVPDAILLKPGALTDEEWVVMRKHPVLAYELLSPIAYLRPALDIPYCHHEKWDGTGYPRGLKGEQIPLAARLFAIVDVWEALLADRPYRKAWSEDRVHEYLRQLSGKHFDPKVVGEFFNLLQVLSLQDESDIRFKERTSGYRSRVFKI